MIRVLNIVETIGFGGVERRRLSMAKLLDKSKYELKIICTKTEGDFADEIRKQGVEVIEIGLLNHSFEYRQHQKVVEVINEFQPHIIHGAVFEGVTMAAVNGFFKRVPIIIVEETSDPQNRRWKGNLLMKGLVKLSDAVIGVSPASVDYLTGKLKIKKEKVFLINNGVAIPGSVPEVEVSNLREQFQIKENDFVIGSVGRMLSDATKRFSDLITAFSIVSAQIENAKLILVGEGNEKENYIRLAKELNIADKVIFAGYQNEVSRYYEIFDVFALVSAHESFGLVLAEAMLHKIPVIATNVGGMKYIVKNNETGFLVEKFNVDAIAARIMELYKDSGLRKQMGIKGYERAMQNYTEERYVSNVEALYHKLLLQKRIIHG